MFAYVLPALSYLLGSVSSAIVIARVMGLEEPRKVGSRKPGATNNLRYRRQTAPGPTLRGDRARCLVRAQSLDRAVACRDLDRDGPAVSLFLGRRARRRGRHAVLCRLDSVGPVLCCDERGDEPHPDRAPRKEH